jgi:ABC-2 type transport system ATP-binding protein
MAEPAAPRSSADCAILTEHLSKSYGTVRAVNDLDLRVERGELFALVGPDGAGKTTAIRMLCAILKPDEGSVSVLGRDLGREAAWVKANVGYFSQRFTLYGDLTIDENIEFFARIHGVKGFRDRREELLDFTRLAPFRGRLADRLSGGMRQKLALACTLIHSPGLILLDEPTTGVDPVSRREFWLILSELLKSGITILMSTPYLDEAERATRVGLMHEGRLLAVDRPGAIRESMRGSILEIVCSDIRRAAAALKLTGAFDNVRLFGDRLNLVVAEAQAGEQALRAALGGAGIDVISCRVVPTSLENAFISLVTAERGER